MWRKNPIKILKQQVIIALNIKLQLLQVFNAFDVKKYHIGEFSA